MSSKQKQALSLIGRFSPTKFGVEYAYYRAVDDNLEITFFVKEKSAPRLISYLKALSNLIETEIKGIRIETNIYYSKEKSELAEVVKDEKLEKITLSNLTQAGAVC
jgi:hypothetical protein